MSAQVVDVIVVGGGHAGVEAATAAARMGVKTLLITHNIDTIGQMSCNPAIGGIGKGHLVKEVDAMGGLMARAADSAGIQFRLLNRSKGPAVRATRAQACRYLYKSAIRQMVESQTNLTIFQQAVADLIIKKDTVCGVVTELGISFLAKTVIFTVGTFLGGKIHIGDLQTAGGRQGCKPSNALADKLRALEFPVGRLKTGTPPRIDGKTVDYCLLTEQPGDTPRPVFSFMGSESSHPKQISCHITYTNERTHQIIRDNIQHSAMYSGNIEGVGPRYCPSIEDKIMRFAHRDKHQIFIEPESLYSDEIYPNGLSTSLPYEVQQQFIHSIKGFENAHITRAGYAIEYDYFDPRVLQPWLETKKLKNLFFAGQINGTTGYEEAAAQGLIAGINAAKKIKSEAMWWPKRNEAYIGVLIDDLITLGTSEPYRMFTSRAEYRLILREDNADQRLTPYAIDFGLIDKKREQAFLNKQAEIKTLLEKVNSTYISLSSIKAEQIKQQLSETISKDLSLAQILKRPSVSINKIVPLYPEIFVDMKKESIAQVETVIKYEGYILRQQEEVDKKLKHENTLIPMDFDYSFISGLSNEVQEKLILHKPVTIGMASRIAGITPASISLLLIQLKKKYGNLRKLESA